MRRSLARVILVALTLVIPLARPSPVAAELCWPVMPETPKAVRGNTFTATVIKVRTEGTSPLFTYFSLTINEVYAKRDSPRLRAGNVLEVLSNACDGFGLVGLEKGDKILMSTAYFDEGNTPSMWNTTVWKIDRGKVRLAVPTGEDFTSIWLGKDRRIARADTLREALALVAPAAIGMPETATQAVSRGPSAGYVTAIGATLIAVLTGFVLALSRRPARIG